MNFEALGEEAGHIKEEISSAQKEGKLPNNISYLISPLTLQEYLEQNPDAVLPDIITTKTHSVIPEKYLDGKKKSIITRSAGYDHFEHLAGIANVTSLREYCVNAVAQTAIKLMYCTTGYLNHYETNTLTFERNKAISFFELNQNRRVTVFGVGKIGKRAYELCVGNGLDTYAVDIREDELKKIYGDSVRFTTKEEAIKNSDIIINTMNLTRNEKSRFYNVGYFGKEYLASAGKKLFFINVTRGEIAPESGLIELYDEGKILGIGVDVFSEEDTFSGALKGKNDFSTPDTKAGKVMLDRAISRTANIYVQPHQAFNSDVAALEKARETVKHIVAWYKNHGERFDEQLPYYEA